MCAADHSAPSVSSYSTLQGTMRLDSGPGPGPRVEALLDVNLLLPALNADNTCRGAWVHVIGYVSTADAAQSPARPGCAGATTVRVEAVMLWLARSLIVSEYEQRLAGHLAHAAADYA
jgi:hypothetical protein